MSLIPATHEYYIEKVYEGISSGHPLGSVNLNMIKQTHQNIKMAYHNATVEKMF